jgi:hypothetical protein
VLTEEAVSLRNILRQWIRNTEDNALREWSRDTVNRVVHVIARIEDAIVKYKHWRKKKGKRKKTPDDAYDELELEAIADGDYMFIGDGETWV